MDIITLYPSNMYYANIFKSKTNYFPILFDIFFELFKNPPSPSKLEVGFFMNINIRQKYG